MPSCPSPSSIHSLVATVVLSVSRCAAGRRQRLNSSAYASETNGGPAPATFEGVRSSPDACCIQINCVSGFGSLLLCGRHGRKVMRTIHMLVKSHWCGCASSVSRFRFRWQNDSSSVMYVFFFVLLSCVPIDHGTFCVCPLAVHGRCFFSMVL